MGGNVFEKQRKKVEIFLKKRLDKRGNTCYTSQAVRRYGSTEQGSEKKICGSERKGLTNRGELVIIAKLLSGTGVRQLGSGKRFRKKSKKGLDKSERVWYNDRAI